MTLNTTKYIRNPGRYGLVIPNEIPTPQGSVELPIDLAFFRAYDFIHPDDIGVIHKLISHVSHRFSEKWYGLFWRREEMASRLVKRDLETVTLKIKNCSWVLKKATGFGPAKYNIYSIAPFTVFAIAVWIKRVHGYELPLDEKGAVEKGSAVLTPKLIAQVEALLQADFGPFLKTPWNGRTEAAQQCLENQPFYKLIGGRKDVDILEGLDLDSLWGSSGGQAP